MTMESLASTHSRVLRTPQWIHADHSWLLNHLWVVMGMTSLVSTHEYGITCEYCILSESMTHEYEITREYYKLMSADMTCLSLMGVGSLASTHSRVLHTHKRIRTDVRTLTHECTVLCCNMHVHPLCTIGIFSRILSSIPLVHAIAGVTSKFRVISYANGNPHTRDVWSVLHRRVFPSMQVIDAVDKFAFFVFVFFTSLLLT